MSETNKPTNIRMPDLTYEQIDQLMVWGYGNTKAAIVVMAVNHLYELALMRRKKDGEAAMNPDVLEK
jgi:predicted DNA-binding protein